MTTIKTVTAVAASAIALAALSPGARAGNPDKLTIAIFAPSLELTSAARVSYLNDVAAAIEAKTGIPTSARSFVKYSDLTAAKPDFAIVEGQCIAARSPGKVLASATLDGERTTDWGLYSHAKGQTITELRGKRVAYVKMGCRDSDFLDYTLLLGIFDHTSFFGTMVAKADSSSAVVATRDMGDADAVIAPARLISGALSLVVRIDDVPNPGFVALNDKLDATLIASAKSALMGTSAGPFTGWVDATGYDNLAGRMSKRKKTLVIAEPAPVDVSEPDAIRVPVATVRTTPHLRLLWKPPAKRPR